MDRPVLAFCVPKFAGDSWRAAMAEHAPHVVFRNRFEGFGDPALVRYAIAWNPPPGELAQFPNLACIFSLGAGVDGILADPTFPRSVPLSRVVDPDLTQGMTQYVLLHVMLHHRKQRAFDSFQRERLWKPLTAGPAGDVRVGIMGTGVLGMDAARKLRDLGYAVSGWNASRKSEPGMTFFAGMGELSAFLAETNILVCLLPLTDATRHIIRAETLRHLPKGAFFINAARGGHVNEDDLLAALDSGQLAGAALDVFETEPLPVTSRLWSHPHVTVTPHVASQSNPKTIAALIGESIRRVERGEAPLNPVDFLRGY